MDMANESAASVQRASRTVRKVRFLCPPEAHDLLCKAAAEAGIDKDEFAKYLFYSALANYAPGVEPSSEIKAIADDVFADSVEHNT